VHCDEGKSNLTTCIFVGIPIIVIQSKKTIRLRTLAVGTVRAGGILEREAGRLFRASRVSAAQFNVLNLLAGNPGGMRGAELAMSLVVDPSSATYLLDQLEQRKLITRQRKEDDRRALQVLLTPAGKRLHAKLATLYQRALEYMVESFEPDELTGAQSFLEKLPEAGVRAIEAVLAEEKPVKTAKAKTRRGRS
jgi:DNA-binding MarR family transcriptional regulator